MSIICISISASLSLYPQWTKSGGHHFPEQATGFILRDSPAPTVRILHVRVWGTQLGHGAVLQGGQAQRRPEKLVRSHRWNSSVPCCSLLSQEGGSGSYFSGT